MGKSSIIKEHCSFCVGIRRHNVLYSTSSKYVEHNDDGKVEYYEKHTYSLIECCGCGNITFLDHVSSNETGGTYTEYYPPLIHRSKPDWLIDLFMHERLDNPFKFEFFNEIYAALSNNMPRLAVIGIRALLEQVMIEKINDNGSFAKNLDEFENKGFISKIQKEAILPVIEAGHASVHRGFKATNKEIQHLMDITENIIESIFINKLKADMLPVPRKGNVNKKNT